MYTLILTLWMVDHRGGVSVTIVPGFADEKSCLASGNQWLKSVESAFYRSGRAQCAYTPVRP